MKHKDEVLLEILRLQRLTFSDEEVEEEAINHGKIQGLMWSAGLFQDYKNHDTFNQWDDEIIKDEEL
jgi:hypothetical protein